MAPYARAAEVWSNSPKTCRNGARAVAYRSEALRTVKRRASFAHPYYWSAFILSGDPQ